jgi:hypothetical protein
MCFALCDYTSNMKVSHETVFQLEGIHFHYTPDDQPPQQRTPYRGPLHQQQHHPQQQQQFRPVQQNRPGFQASGPSSSTSGTRTTGPKKGCWTCGEPHYQCDCPVERTRVSRSAKPTTVGDMGKAHRIHAAVNNRQAEHQSTVLKTTGTIADQTLSVLIDPVLLRVSFLVQC